jgi:SEC-C motif
VISKTYALHANKWVKSQNIRGRQGAQLISPRKKNERCLSKIECDALASVAPKGIGNWVVTVNEWRLENYDPKQGKSRPPPAMHDSPVKVGRNNPCPCGSGKKYKKCCGLNSFIAPKTIAGLGV